MKEKKSNKKILNIIILVIAIVFSSIAGVYAERIIASSNVTYSNSTSGLASTDVQGAIDELYTKFARCANSFGNFSCYLQALPASETVITDDGTADHNMRYMGKTPNNYVTFAGEEWRVIGVFNNVDDGTGKKETRVKIIKAESIGTKQWNSNNRNIWKSASLNTELQALSYASNSMVENAVWHLGDGGTMSIIAAQSYINERGTTVASENDATWTGKVGLMYSSDYGFASSVCKDGTKTLNEYDATDVDCKGTDWLFLGSDEWLLSPYSGNPYSVRDVYSSGLVASNGAANSRAVRPVVFIKSSVTCKNCSDSTAGTKENPFLLG